MRKLAVALHLTQLLLLLLGDLSKRHLSLDLGMHVVGSLAILNGDVNHTGIATWGGDCCAAMLTVDTNSQ